MSNNNPLPTELNEQELLETARLYRILRLVSEKEKESDDEGALEKRWDELEFNNPFFSRYMWTGEVEGQPANKDPKSLLAELSLSS
jgi:hypothetical protein